MLISLTGFDGAGKTTQVRLLYKYLKEKKKKVYVTEKMFTYFLLKPLVKVLRKHTKSPVGGPVTENKKLIPKLWFILAFIDIWIGYLLKYRPMLQKFDYIIADRFYTDIWANLLYYGYLPQWAFGFFVKLLPKSDVAIMLSVKPETVLRREEDFPTDYYKKQAKIYKKLANKLTFEIINANRQPKNVFEDIRSRVDNDQVEK